MEDLFIVGYFLALLVGIILGLMGSGGSILSVPIFVYIMNVSPVLATAYSLFVVGITALIGGIQKAKQQLVDYKNAISFGIPTLISVFVTRKFIVPNISETIIISDTISVQKATLIMVFFAIVMIVSSIRMIRPMKVDDRIILPTPNYFQIVFQGIIIGLISGFVGAGGGFLIIPALVFMARIPMKIAVGTSLLIVSAQSLIGFLGDIQANQTMNWEMLGIFTIFSVIGIFIGNNLAKKMNSDKLKIAFGWFVFIMGSYILIKEIFFSK
jgi:uncharacterized membrane protein YfcA